MHVVVPGDSPEVLARFQAELQRVDAVARHISREIGDVLDLDELTSFGQEGLLIAARRYDPARGIPFRRYAYHRMRGAMIDGMRRHGALPRRAHAKLRVLQTVNLMSSGFFDDNQAATQAGLTAEAADDRLADQLGTLASAMAVGFLGNDVQHQDGERISADGDRPDRRAEQQELMRIVDEELSTMPQQEAVLVKRHFFRDERLEDIAADLGLSKSWGSRLMARGIERISKRLHDDA